MKRLRDPLQSLLALESRRKSHRMQPSACDPVVAGPYDRNAGQRTPPLLGSANQEIHFVTRRYGPRDLAEVPNAEIVMNGMQIVLSGL